MTIIRQVMKLSLTVSLIVLLSLLSGCVSSSQRWGDAPDFTLKTLDGKTIKLSDYIGTVILLDFMGVDCPYCLYQMSELKKISDNYSRSDVIIISIDVYNYETEEYLQSYIDWFNDELGIDLDWTFGLDETGIIANDYIKPDEGVPKLVIVDQNGNVYYSRSGYTEYSILAGEIDELI